jgi:MAE_28990/MAE_18760-like HEPN
MPSPISDVVNELDLVKTGCLGLLADLRSFYPVAAGTPYPDTYRLLVVPILYAAWERCFTISNAIVWRRLRDETKSAGALISSEKAAWLMKAGFYQSYRKTLLNIAGGSDRKPKKSHFPALSTFLSELELWCGNPLDVSIDTDDLVMRFGNVNPEVVALNAEALGIHTFPAFRNMQFGRLHTLVELRNGIGHGGTLNPPDNAEFIDLWSFTEQVIENYSEVFKAWIVLRFPPPPPPPGFFERLRRESSQFIKNMRAG